MTYGWIFDISVEIGTITSAHLFYFVKLVPFNIHISVQCFVVQCLSFGFFFWPFYCLSFELQFLITLLVSSDYPFGIFNLFLFIV